jgi:hypothetical protein
MANQEFNSVPRSFAIVINTDVALETLVRLGKIVVKLLTSHSHGSQPRASGQFFSAAADGDDDDSDHKVPVPGNGIPPTAKSSAPGVPAAEPGR